MARNLNALVLVLLAVATTLHGSAAQTRHVVGDTTGWTIPSGGAATYVTWAATKTFAVGDTLVFNFTTGQHDVAKVTKSNFDGCNGKSTLSTMTNGPASVTLNATGEQYYICTFGTHCSLGQKLAINVSKASKSPSTASAPQPSGTSSPKTSPIPSPTPTPKSSPTPAPPPTAKSPSSAPVTYTVGDTLGWTVPKSGAAAYKTWSSGKNFKVGDILVFNFQLNQHNVDEVTKEKYDSCNLTSPLATYTTPPVRVTLKKSGTHYFICGFPEHCPGGQKLAINVTGSGGSTATPSSTATPPSSATSPPPSSPPTPSSASPTGAASPPPSNSSPASFGAVGLFATFLSIAAALFY